jgi:hypothetical protein
MLAVDLANDLAAALVLALANWTCAGLNIGV